MAEFTKYYTAVLGTGCRKFIEEFYDIQHSPSERHIINMQIRYWVEAVEKYYNINEDEYSPDMIEEAILTINNLANSLLCLGGVNWKGGGIVPSLLDLYDNHPFPLKRDKPYLYAALVELNKLYNKLSKHLSKNRNELYSMLTYKKLTQLFEAVREIWLWVCNDIFKNGSFDLLFTEPMDIIKREF